MSMDDETRWFHVDKPESVSLVVHGLNMKPRHMGDIVDLLQETRSETLRVAMTGHSKEKPAWSFVGQKHWLDDVKRGVEEGANRAEKLGVPFHGVGYSMGGQYLIDGLNDMGGATDRNVLLAPSIALNPEARSQLLYARWLGPFPTPSSLEEYYRSNSTIPGSAYSAMASSQFALESSADTAALNVPTMVILDQDDEWISESGIREFMTRHQLTNWAMLMLRRSKEAVKGK